MHTGDATSQSLSSSLLLINSRTMLQNRSLLPLEAIDGGVPEPTIVNLDALVFEKEVIYTNVIKYN